MQDSGDCHVYSVFSSALSLHMQFAFGQLYVNASVLSAVPFVVGSVIHAHTEPMTDTTITGLLTALRKASHSAAQVVMSCHCTPRPTKIGLTRAIASCIQNVGFFNRTFQLMFFSICIPPNFNFCPPLLEGLCLSLRPTAPGCTWTVQAGP